MAGPSKDTLGFFVSYIRATNPSALQIFIAESEREFFGAAEGAIESALREMERNGNNLGALGELGLSNYLAGLLRSAMIPASSEEYCRGHVDITITHPRNHSVRYLGECKIWKGASYHLKGLGQIILHYSAGRERRVFCLEFFRSAAMYKRMGRLRRELNKKRPLRQSANAEDHSIKGAFLTTHLHPAGDKLEVLHLGCNLYREKL